MEISILLNIKEYDSWTDYNGHDSGVTILEQLIYALSDLSYRINFSIPDLLLEAGSEKNLSHSEKILSSRSVTLLDLRKLLIDIKGVKNAWVEPVEIAPAIFYDVEEHELLLEASESLLEPVKLKGLYKVFVEKEGDTDPDKAFSRCIYNNRNLCEDFVEPQVLTQRNIHIDSIIEIDTGFNPEVVYRAIIPAIENYFSPAIRRYSLEEMLEKGHSLDEIFEGPLLQHGFIDSKELQQHQRRTEIRKSDLIQIIMDIPGVRAIHELSLSMEGLNKTTKTGTEESTARSISNKAVKDKSNPDNDWLEVLKNENETPWFGPSRFILMSNKAEAAFNYPDDYNNPEEASADELGAGLISQTQTNTIKGSPRNIENYYSILHQFPDNYGVNSHGLPDQATPLRKAQAKQLKAYLLLFDQLLANQFSQLAHAGELLSFNQHPPYSTWFSQELDDKSLGLEEILEKNSSDEPELSHDNDERKNRFLDHLLARVGEQLTDYSLFTRGQDQKTADVIAHKQRFLREYPTSSANRGTGINYKDPSASWQRSGLEQRIRYRLGFPEDKHFYILEHILLRPIKDEHKDKKRIAPILSAVGRKDPYSLQLTVVFPEPLSDAVTSYKSFAEEVVREETPAHICCYIRWLDEEAMKGFQKAYDYWLETMQETAGGHQ